MSTVYYDYNLVQIYILKTDQNKYQPIVQHTIYNELNHRQTERDDKVLFRLFIWNAYSITITFQ